MAELDRVLDVLLHDLRSPLSVASGYVRLLKMDKLDTFEAREKAWTQTATALTRIAHLCDEASGFLPHAVGAARRIPAGQLTTRVKQLCKDRGIECDDRTSALDGLTIEGRSDADRLSDAVVTLVGLQHPAGHPVHLTVAADSRALVFTVPVQAPIEAPCLDESYDPWKLPGLGAALACHTIALASGEVRATHELTISFPLQESHS